MSGHFLHFFSRNRNCHSLTGHVTAQEFAVSLAALDQLFLLPIYPARELPIPGVTSEWLRDITPMETKVVLQAHEVLMALRTIKKGVVCALTALGYCYS